MIKQKNIRWGLILTLLYLLFSSQISHAQKEVPYCPSLDSFIIKPHLPPISQGHTGTCWSYSMVSLLESEHLRLHNDTIKLSEMWFAYYDFIEKFIRISNNPEEPFVEGSECNSILYCIDKYGAVPSYAYLGRIEKSTFFDYSTMFEKLMIIMTKVKNSKLVNIEKQRKKYIKTLNTTMTCPPVVFTDKTTSNPTTPKEYAKNSLKISTYDYFCFMSNAQLPFGQRGVLQEPDNWWQDKSYYNLPIEIFLTAIKEALLNNYTVVVSGDVTNKSYQPHTPFSWYNNDNIRNMDSVRLVEKKAGLTADDHSWHIVGYYPSKDGWWFYIKDSAFWDDPINGYHYIHESYLRRKSVSLIMHKYAARTVVNKIIK